MGGASLRQITSTSTVVNIATFDIIIVESRSGQVIPETWKANDKLCNFGWLKQCIVSVLAPADGYISVS